MTDKLPLQCPVCPNRKPVTGARCPRCDTDLEPLRRIWELPGHLAREGLRLRETGAETAGFAFLTAAAVLTQDPLDSRVALARLLVEQGKYPQAQEVLEPILARDPEHPEPRRLQQLCREAREGQEVEKQRAARSRAETGRNLRRRWLSLGAASTVLSGVLVFFLTWAILRQPPAQPPPAPEVTLNFSVLPDPVLARAKAAVASASPTIRVEESGSGLRLSGEVLSYRELADLLKAVQEAVGLTCEDVKVKYETFFFYRIRPGDSLTSLAQRFYGSPGRFRVIQAANPDRVKDVNFLRPGDLLMIPGTAETGP